LPRFSAAADRGRNAAPTGMQIGTWVGVNSWVLKRNMHLLGYAMRLLTYNERPAKLPLNNSRVRSWQALVVPIVIQQYQCSMSLSPDRWGKCS
jgi:hypothetical protein